MKVIEWLNQRLMWAIKRGQGRDESIKEAFDGRDGSRQIENRGEQHGRERMVIHDRAETGSL